MIGLDEIEARLLGSSRGDESCFWTRAGRGYRDGLARMAELPADDPIWAGSNGRVTDYKLDQFCEVLRQRDPRDQRALWTTIGCDVRCCSNALHEPSWLALFKLGDFQPQWLVEHAYWVEVVSGKDTVLLVSDVLQRHRLIEAAQSALHALRSAAPVWVDRVVDQLSGREY